MKQIKTILLSVALLALALPATADLFNCTNTFNNAVSIVSWPTNSVGTNGIGALTGGPINLQWNDTAGFSYAGYVTAAAGWSNQTGAIQFTMLRSWSDTAPLVTTNRCDWETNSFFCIYIPITGPGLITYGTNLTQEVIGRANWLGIYAITNSCAFLSVTNRVPTSTAINSWCLGNGAALNTKVQGVRLR